MRGAVAALALFCAAGQDGPPKLQDKVDELAERLGDEDPVVRERAQQELVAMGAAIVPALEQIARQTRDAEVRGRAEAAIRRIRMEDKLSKVYQEPRRATLRFNAKSPKAILDEYEKIYGVTIRPARLPEVGVSFEIKEAGLLQALDTLCAAVDGLNYDLDENAVRLTSSPFLPYPSAYSGPFRVRVTELTRTVHQTFENLTARVDLKLHADWTPDVKPLPAHFIEVIETKDSEGNALEAANAGGMNNPAQWAAFRRRGGMPRDTLVTLTSIQPSVDRLALLRCRATFRFPLDTQTARIDSPSTNSEVKVGEYRVRVTSVSSSYIMMNISADSESTAAGLVDAVDFDSFEVFDKENNSEKTQVSPSGGSDRNYQFYIRVPHNLRQKGISHITFKVRDVHSMTFEFEIRDIAIPR